ncbi:MAG: hypothetical protein U1F43_05025 [Myxococcota bacterium]
MHTRGRVLAGLVAVVVSGFGLAACASGALDPGALVVVLGMGLALPFAGRARAGAPMPCNGSETESCDGHRINRSCCPAGAGCNFEHPPYLACGGGLCVLGHDPGRCEAPVASTMPARDEADCKAQYGSWEPACIEHHVVEACLPPVPTNFTGPALNPPFTTCGKDRCTTHALAVDCQPTYFELWLAAWPALPTCDGKWAEVCLDGQVETRCMLWSGDLLEKPPAPPRWVTCPDNSCAVGSDAKRACAR